MLRNSNAQRSQKTYLEGVTGDPYMFGVEGVPISLPGVPGIGVDSDMFDELVLNPADPIWQFVKVSPRFGHLNGLTSV